MSAWKPPRDSSGFFLSSGPSPITISIESDRIEECMSYYKSQGLTRVSVSPLMGYSRLNLEFLKDYPFIRGVSLPDASGIDINGLGFLEDSLEYLLVANNRQALDLGRFGKLKELRADWHSRLGITSACRQLRILDLSKYKPSTKDLNELASLPKLEDLSIVQSPLTSINGIGRFYLLRRLELSYLTKLESVAGIKELSGSELEILECEKCKKIGDHASVRSVPSLRVVRFNDCGEMPSLGFLNGMPHIEDFRFVNTNVIDGDLRPLLRLKSTGFFKKKHYSHSPEEVDTIIEGNTVGR